MSDVKLVKILTLGTFILLAMHFSMIIANNAKWENKLTMSMRLAQSFTPKSQIEEAGKTHNTVFWIFIQILQISYCITIFVTGMMSVAFCVENRINYIVLLSKFLRSTLIILLVITILFNITTLSYAIVVYKEIVMAIVSVFLTSISGFFQLFFFYKFYILTKEDCKLSLLAFHDHLINFRASPITKMRKKH